MSGRQIRWESAGRVAAIAVGVVAVLVALPSLLRTEPPAPPADVGLVQAAPAPRPDPVVSPPPPPPKPSQGTRKRKGAARRAVAKPGSARKQPGRAPSRPHSPEPQGESQPGAPVTAAAPPAVAYVPPAPRRERFGFER